MYASNAEYEGEAVAYLLDATGDVLYYFDMHLRPTEISGFSDVGDNWDANVRDPGQKITAGMSFTSKSNDTHNEETCLRFPRVS